MVEWNHEARGFTEACGMDDEHAAGLIERYNQVCDEAKAGKYPECSSGYAQMMYDNFDKHEAIVLMKIVIDQMRHKRCGGNDLARLLDSLKRGGLDD